MDFKITCWGKRGYSTLKHFLFSMSATLISPIQYLSKWHAATVLQGKSRLLSLTNERI